MKKVLVLCTGNSCRSIIAEALINAKVEGVEAKSSGVRASGKVNPNAKKLLEEKEIWRDEYHSKTLDTVKDEEFDLVVTVCDHANETCPIFPRPVKKIHVGFSDPDGKGYEAFEATYKEIEEVLLPKIKEELFGMKKEVTQLKSGVKIKFSGAVQKENIVKMVQNCKTGACECMSDATKEKIKDMQVSGEDGEVLLELSGEVQKEEIEAALAKSKVCQNNC
jgi:arsenate reductase